MSVLAYFYISRSCLSRRSWIRHKLWCELLRSNLKVDEVRPKIKKIIDKLFIAVPSGVGSEGKLRVSDRELDEIFVIGAKWAVEDGYGSEDDLNHCEKISGARPEVVSKKPRDRGRAQLGTLGSGNHFLGVQYVDKIFDERVARFLGWRKG